MPKRYTGHPGCAASLRLPSLYRDGYLKKVHLVTALQTYCDHFSPLGNVILFLLHENHTCCWQCAWLGPTLGWKLLLPLPLSTNRHMDSTAKVENFLRTAVRNGIMPGSSEGCIEIAAGWGVEHTISMYSIAILPGWSHFFMPPTRLKVHSLQPNPFDTLRLRWVDNLWGRAPAVPRTGQASRIRGAESASAGCVETAGLFSQRTSRNATCRALVLRQIGFASLEKQESRSRGSNRRFFGGMCLTLFDEISWSWKGCPPFSSSLVHEFADSPII